MVSPLVRAHVAGSSPHLRAPAALTSREKNVRSSLSLECREDRKPLEGAAACAQLAMLHH